jgi:8-oxo-dGTP pyrophosphatase MutT (NUDIX family)
MTLADPVNPPIEGHAPRDSLPLKALLLARLAPAPCPVIADDWRFGELTAERRERLRRYQTSDPEPAAELVHLVERREGLSVLLTRRSRQLSHHPGQISFPGGRLETIDSDPCAAALRETEEEIGLGREHVSVAGYLPDHLIVSGYQVTPVVGFVQPFFELRLDRSEVEETFEVPLAFVLDARNHVRTVREYKGESLEFVDLPYGPHHIWGATAGILLTLYRLLQPQSASSSG